MRLRIDGIKLNLCVLRLLRRKLLALSVFSDDVKCTTIYWPITGDDVTS